jgi:hypothetical protein
MGTAKYAAFFARDGKGHYSMGSGKGRADRSLGEEHL